MSAPPPGWLLACLTLWGGFTGHLAAAVPMGMLLEAPRLLPWRFQLADRDLYRVADASAVLFVVMVIYLFNQYSIHGIYAVLAWQPFIFFPLALSQSFEQRQGIPLSALFLSVRRQIRAGVESDRLVDLRYPYGALTLLAASTTQSRGMYLYLLAAALGIWALWRARNRRYSPLVWCAVIVLAVGIGFSAQSGVRSVQKHLEQVALSWLNDFWWRGRDPLSARTAIGSLGRVKLSDRIRLRVSLGNGATPPLLLREASFQKFRFGTWSNVEHPFSAFDPLPDGKHWRFNDRPGRQTATIELHQKEELIVLPLPVGTDELYHPDAIEIQRNALGVTKLDSRAGLQRYTAHFSPDRSRPATTPDAADLQVPEDYAKFLRELIVERHLQGATDAQTVARLTRFFEEHYRYSLVPRRGYTRRSLIDFLTDQPYGHCEYFASATVLLLRQAGIPARYAVGYAVQEYSPLERRYLVRARAAHSWAEAYFDGGWQVVDTTPSRWAVWEREDRSALIPLYDLISWMRYVFERWRSGGDLLSDSFLLSLVPVLLAFLAYRFYRGGRLRRTPSSTVAAGAALAGADSECYRVLDSLAAQGYPIRCGETLRRYCQRIAQVERLAPLRDRLEPMVALHYRYRFHPDGLDAHGRARLTAAAAAVLQAVDSAPKRTVGARSG